MSYQKAVDWLVPICRQLIADGQIKLPPLPSSHVLLKVRLGLSPKNGAYSIDDSLAMKLLYMAEEDTGAFDLMVEICATNIMAGAELGAPLRLFAAQVLTGDILKPKGEKRDQTWLENQYLLALVFKVSSNFSLQKTRNEASPEESAADAVSQCFQGAGCDDVNYERLRKLCSSRRYARMRQEMKEWAVAVSHLSKDELIGIYGVSEIFWPPNER